MKIRGRLAALAVVLALAGPAAQADKPTTVRLASLAPEGTPWHDVLLELRDEWRTISGGKVTVRTFGGALGDESEMIRKLRLGQIQAVAISGASLPRLDLSVAALQVPMMFESYEELDGVRAEIEPKLEARLEAVGFVVLNWSDAGWVRLFSKQPVRTPDDLRKITLLTTAGDLATEKLYKDFGFNVRPLAYTEVLVGLETGLIDAVPGPALYALKDQWFGLAKHMTDVRWMPLIGATVIRKDVWESFPAEWRGPMKESARAAGRRAMERIRALGDDAVVEMRKRGLQVVVPAAADLAKWRAEAERAYPRLRGEYAPAEIFDEVLRARDRFRAQRAKP